MTNKQSLLLRSKQSLISAKQKRSNAILANARNNTKQRVTLFLNPSLLIHARAQAIVEGSSLTVLVERALMKYLPKKTVINKAVI